MCIWKEKGSFWCFSEVIKSHFSDSVVFRIPTVTNQMISKYELPSVTVKEKRVFWIHILEIIWMKAYFKWEEIFECFMQTNVNHTCRKIQCIRSVETFRDESMLTTGLPKRQCFSSFLYDKHQIFFRL